MSNKTFDNPLIVAIDEDLNKLVWEGEEPYCFTWQGHYYTSAFFYRCKQCDALFIEIQGHIRCNGYIIGDCPWCSPKSLNAANARGAILFREKGV